MPNAIEVSNVTMKFNMSKDKVDSIKEYFIKLCKRQLRFEEFTALQNVSVNIEKGEMCIRDRIYIENYSFLLDLKLMILTLRVVMMPDKTEGIQQGERMAQTKKTTEE